MITEIIVSILGFSVLLIMTILVFGHDIIIKIIETKQEQAKHYNKNLKLSILKYEHKENLKYKIKYCIIVIITILIICIIVKLFGFSIKDIANLIN